MGENTTRKGAALAKLAATVVLAGALAAGLVLPEVGGLGLAARNSADLINGLPDQLTINPPAGNTKVLAADGSVITEFYSNNRIPVTSDQIATVMKQAQVDIEDSRFYEHAGVDLQGTVRALATNLSAGSVKEGGSTLTQQLVKQTLLQTADTPAERQAATQQSVGRKIREARLAMGVDQKYSKDEILARYLNTVYFGEGSYGVEAAAEKYFSVHAKDLTLPQAATLAGLVQSPSGDDPIANPQNATTRRNEVLKRMHDLKHITDQQYQEAVASPVQVVEGQAPPNGCLGAAIAPFFCDYVQGYLTGTLKISQNVLNGGGLTIKTTLQPDLQRSSDQSLTQHIPMDKVFNGVLDAVQPGTGHVLAMSVNRRYGCKDTGCTSVNYADVAAKGSGSTYKVFTAAAALSQGFGAHYTITAPQPYYSHVFKGYQGDPPVLGPYHVMNDDPGYKPTYDMTSALVASTNTYYVALEDALGSITPGVQTSEAMGMHYGNAVTQNSADYMIKHQIGAFTLGYNATNPLDLANSYATVAASGTRCEPTPVTAVLDQNGQPLKDDNGNPYDTGDHCTPNALAPGVANTLANMMVGVVSPAGTGRKAVIPGHTIGGKTGTTQGNITAAFGGITPDYSVAVMYFDPQTDPDKVVPVGGVGGGVPALVYHDAMAPILGPQPDHPFPPADPAVVAGTRGAGPGAASGDDAGSTSGADTAGGDGGAGGGADTNPAPDNGGNGNGNYRNDGNTNGNYRNGGGGNRGGGNG
jgi:membrane peptidoglycan carboxypeptidase